METAKIGDGAFVEINHNITTLVPGAIATVTVSAIDPEGVDLIYVLEDDSPNVDIVQGSEEYEIVEGVCVDSSGNVENTTCNNDNDCGVSTCNDELVKKYYTASFAISDDFNAPSFTVNFSAEDENNQSVSVSETFDVVATNFDPQINFEVLECTSNCNFSNATFNIIAPNGDGDYETAEGNTIRIDASSSFDATQTGVLTYNWSNLFLDVNGDGTNDLDLDIEEGVFDIKVPEYVAIERILNLVLTLSDGCLLYTSDAADE